MSGFTQAAGRVLRGAGAPVLRVAATVALTVALVGVGATAAPAQEGPPVQPGVSIETDGSYCTLAWIFERIEQDPDDPEGEPEVSLYASTAAHCVDEVGQQVNLADTSLGESLGRLGEVAFRGDPDAPGRDYAFIAIDEANWERVDAAMVGHPDVPTGVSEDPQEGDLMQFSGHGVGFHLSEPTRQERVGVLNWFNDREHGVTGGVTLGDSGGPVADVTDGNTAFGIVNTVEAGVVSPSLTVVQAGEGGANLSFVLDDAAARGFDAGELCVVDQPCGQRGVAPARTSAPEDHTVEISDVTEMVIPVR